MNLIEDNDVLVVEAYVSCRGCNIIPRSDLLSDIELCSSCANKQRCISCNRYLGLHLYTDDDTRCHACVRKSTQFGSGAEKSIYKYLGDSVEEHIVTGETINPKLRISLRLQMTRSSLHWMML